MNIFINSDKKYCIQHENINSLNIDQFMNTISNITNIPEDTLHVSYHGKSIYPYNYSNINIQDGDTFNVNCKLIGGKKRKCKKNKNSNSSKNNRIKEEFMGNPLDAVIGPIIDIANGIIGIAMDIGDIALLIAKIVPWLFEVLIWLFRDILNPMVWIQDVIGGAVYGVQIMVLGLFDGFVALIRKIVNMIFTPLVHGIWGDADPGKTNAKCYKLPDCSVPYPVLLGTVILPPLGVFMELGIKGWLNILICALLTLAYYVPGLVYALIILYC